MSGLYTPSGRDWGSAASSSIGDSLMFSLVVRWSMGHTMYEQVYNRKIVCTGLLGNVVALLQGNSNLAARLLRGCMAKFNLRRTRTYHSMLDVRASYHAFHIGNAQSQEARYVHFDGTDLEVKGLPTRMRPARDPSLGRSGRG